MMASPKNNYVVNYFTLDISNLVSQSQSSRQSSFECEYEIVTENAGNTEIATNDAINAELIDENPVEENNNEEKIQITENVLIQQAFQELSENETSGHEVTSDEDDDLGDLTNLNWLTQLKNLTNLPPTAQEVVEKPCDPPSQRFDKFMNQVHKIKESYETQRDFYQNSSSEKPPYNYAQIIAMAMVDEGRMTLKQICDWIKRRFAYYRVRKTWNNSIRHNLSLNFFFSKVARDKNEKGKGGYWELGVDSNKTARKRIRQRKKKFGMLGEKARAGKRFEKRPKTSTTSSSYSNIGSDAFLSSPSNNNEDSNLSIEEQTFTEVELVEEQQNINNIIDDNQHAIIISNPIFESPNVIVEAIPSYQYTQFSQIGNFDEIEFNQMICMDEQDLIDGFLNYNENEVFL